MDTRALNHILTHSADYQKPRGARYALTRLLGAGTDFNDTLVMIIQLI